MQAKFDKDSEIRETSVKQLIYWSCIMLYFLINLLFLIRHEPYRDESNVWLMAKNLSPIELIREIHYQGHPCLWYLLVMPFAKIGLPYRTIEILSFLIMLFAAVLFIHKAKLIGLAKITCLFSPIFLYFYPVVARGYCLIILLLVFIALLYEKRFQQPLLYGLLLGLLIQADTIAIGIAGGLSIAWLTEGIYATYFKKRKKDYLFTAIKGLWIPLCSLVFWILQMAAEVGNIGGGEHASFSRESFVPDCKGYAYYMVERLTGWSHRGILLSGLLVLVASLLISVCSKQLIGLFVFAFEYLYMTVFSVLIYGLHIWHFICLAFVFFWMIWMQQSCAEKEEETKKDKEGSLSEKVLFVSKYVLNTLAVIFSIACFLHWNSDEERSSLEVALHGVFSNAGEAATFIEENVPTDALIVSTNVSFDTSILAFLEDYRFHWMTDGEEVNHAVYAGKELEHATVSEVEGWIRDQYPECEQYYFIVSPESQLDERGDLYNKGTLLYESEEKSVHNEDYQIYLMKMSNRF